MISSEGIVIKRINKTNYMVFNVFDKSYGYMSYIYFNKDFINVSPSDIIQIYRKYKNSNLITKLSIIDSIGSHFIDNTSIIPLLISSMMDISNYLCQYLDNSSYIHMHAVLKAYKNNEADGFIINKYFQYEKHAIQSITHENIEKPAELIIYLRENIKYIPKSRLMLQKILFNRKTNIESRHKQ